jgi:hypothetical protein
MFQSIAVQIGEADEVEQDSTKDLTTARVDIGPLLRPSVPVSSVLKQKLEEARRRAEKLRRLMERIEDALKEDESQDKLGRFELQEMLKRFNQAETLATTISKSRDEIAALLITRSS